MENWGGGGVQGGKGGKGGEGEGRREGRKEEGTEVSGAGLVWGGVYMTAKAMGNKPIEVEDWTGSSIAGYKMRRGTEIGGMVGEDAER